MQCKNLYILFFSAAFGSYRATLSPRLRRNYLIKYFTFSGIIFLTVANASAQTADTAFVDTVSMKHIDTMSGFDDDGYADDTSIKHIYDTSQYFFTWKKYYNDPFVSKKIPHRSLPDSTIGQLKSSKDFWYIPAIEKLERRIKTDSAFRDSLIKATSGEFRDDQQNFTQQPWFNTLLWYIFIGIFLAALVYFLIQNKINLFSKRSLTLANETDNSDEYADIFHRPYDELLRKAENEENYRGAVRFLYLQTLKLLSDTGTIQYKADYTNQQYVQQLSGSDLYDNFFTVTRHYEFVWYGNFDVTKRLYEKVKHDFHILQNKIRA